MTLPENRKSEKQERLSARIHINNPTLHDKNMVFMDIIELLFKKLARFTLYVRDSPPLWFDTSNRCEVLLYTIKYRNIVIHGHLQAALQDVG